MTAPGGEWLTDAPVVLVAGPGGVGSATVGAAMALAAAERGADVLLVPIGARPGVARASGVERVGDREQELRRTTTGGRLRARTIPAIEAFSDVLELGGVRGVLRRAATAPALPLITAGAPGLQDVLTLARIDEIAPRSGADVVIVAAPPAGGAATFLGAAGRLPDSLGSGAVAERAAAARAMLADVARSRIVLVATLCEPAVRGVCELSDRIRADLVRVVGPLVVNHDRPLPELADQPVAEAAGRAAVTLSPAAVTALEGAATVARERRARERALLDRLVAAGLPPAARLPHLPGGVAAPADLDLLAEALLGPT